MMTPGTKALHNLLVGIALVMCLWLAGLHYFWGIPPHLTITAYEESSYGNTEVPTAPRSIEQRSYTLPVDSSSKQSGGYVITVRYNGQQSAGVRSMISQTCWVGRSGLPMQVVEPVFLDSFVEVVRTEAVQQEAMYMSDYFDTEHFKNALNEMGYARLASWEEFIEKASRKVIFIKTQNAAIWQLNHMEPVKLFWEAKEVNQCYHPLADAEVNYLIEKHDFCIVRFLKIVPTTVVAFTEEEMQNIIFKGWKAEDVTVVFEKWLGAWHVAPTFNSTSVCEDSHERGLKGNLLPSQKLVEDAIEYERKFSDDGKPFKVAVMLRSEHMLRNLPAETMRENFTDCLDEVYSVTKALQSHTDSSHVFLTADIGRYGSTAFNTVHFQDFNLGRKEAFKMVENTIVTLFERGMSFTEWEDTFEEATGGISDRGYIAGIQRTVASRADCIVLVGGGQFPKVGLLEYMELHRDQPFEEWCIHLVCIVGRHTAEYDEILRSAKESAVENTA